MQKQRIWTDGTRIIIIPISEGMIRSRFSMGSQQTMVDVLRYKPAFNHERTLLRALPFRFCLNHAR